MSEASNDRRRPRSLSAEMKWEIFLQITAGEISQAEAARKWHGSALGTEECPSEMWIVDSEPPHRGFFATRAVAEILTAQGEGTGRIPRQRTCGTQLWQFVKANIIVAQRVSPITETMSA